MGAPQRPRRGSIAYSPRKRARSEVPRVRTWPEGDEKPCLLGFAGYKAGMTHVVMVDDKPHSLTENMEISVPVTIVETPAMKVAAIRAYSGDTYGLKVIAEAWAANLDNDIKKSITKFNAKDNAASLAKIEQLINEGSVKDLRVITYTTPAKVTGIPKKAPDIMEHGISGKNLKTKFEYARAILGGAVGISDIFDSGDIIDVLAVTKGKGTQGPVKRWGIQLMKAKHSRAGSVRQIGTLGPWHPHRVSWRVPQMGQTGYYQRTDFNKRILQIGTDGSKVTPAGGFLNYGVVRNEYVIVKGSIPGPTKRLVRLRPAVRAKTVPKVPSISYISLESKQG